MGCKSNKVDVERREGEGKVPRRSVFVLKRVTATEDVTVEESRCDLEISSVLNPSVDGVEGMTRRLKLQSRPWIVFESLKSDAKSDAKQSNMSLCANVCLPKGVTRGCSDCIDCQKVQMARKKRSGSNSQRHDDENEEARPQNKKEKPTKYDQDGKLIMDPDEKSDGVWFGHPKVTEFMIDSIHANYDGFYPSWSTTPRERQEHMWNHFKGKVKADDLKELELCYYLHIKKKFRDQIFRAARKKTAPKWMTAGCFAKLLTRKKDDPKFAEISKKATENRCKGGKEGKALPTHVLGRKSAARALDSACSKETDDVSPFKLLELSKKNKQGKWITPRAEQIANDYMKKMAEKEAGKLDMTEDQIYLETAGGFDRKGRVYGTGETATQFFEPPNVTRSSRAAHTPTYVPGVVSKTMAENEHLKARLKEVEDRQNMMMTFMQQKFGFPPADQSCNPGPLPFRRDNFSDDHGDAHGFGSIVPPT